MFGYVKPFIPTLRVGEYEAYKGIYCGVCRAMGKVTGHPSRLGLSYDYVFLAALRLAAEGVPISFKRKSCIAHPITKRNTALPCDVFDYCAAAGAILASAKLKDDVSDEKGMKRLGITFYIPIKNGAMKRLPEKYLPLKNAVEEQLDILSQIEKAKESSIDIPADIFGRILGEICSFGYDGEIKRITFEIGHSVGRFIYVADAADDAPKDRKCGSYNPILLSYVDALTVGPDGKERLKKNVATDLFTAISLDAARAGAALDLINPENKGIYLGILSNIINFGIGKEAERLLFGGQAAKKDTDTVFTEGN